MNKDIDFGLKILKFKLLFSTYYLFNLGETYLILFCFIFFNYKVGINSTNNNENTYNINCEIQSKHLYNIYYSAWYKISAQEIVFLNCWNIKG